VPKPRGGFRIINPPFKHLKDIQDCFPGVQAKTVCRVFEANGFPEDVASLLARLTTHKSRLPQGAPTSPAIARIVLYDVSKEFEALLSSISPHARATIYVDDITISGPIGLEHLIPTIISVFERHGYSVNPLKKKIMMQNEEQIVWDFESIVAWNQVLNLKQHLS
jgi:hypothetical protein